MIKDIFKNAFVFIQKNPAILLSLALLIIIPLALYFYAFRVVGQFKNIIADEIEANAATAKETLRILVERDFPAAGKANAPALQKAIDRIAAEEIRLKNIRVIVKDASGYRAIAAQVPEAIGQPIDVSPSFNGETLIALGWVNVNENVGSEIEIDGQKYRRVVKIFIDDETGEVYALATADIAINRPLRMIAAAIYESYAVIAAIILLNLVFVFQHAKLFTYVDRTRRLQDENKAKDNFIRMATHELRSPVTVLNAYTESLKEELLPIADDNQRQYIDRMALSVKNLSDLMEDILEVSHLQQGRTDFAPEPIAPDQVVKEIVDGIRHKAEAKGLALMFDAANFNDRKISANPVCFKRIVTNLVENAVKYTPAGKVMVAVIAQTAKKRCLILVQDTGFGISAEGQEHLFQQFYRVKTQANAGIPGTGLGLWMSREMARKMGGDILLESIEQMGSRFFVYFPLADKA